MPSNNLAHFSSEESLSEGQQNRNSSSGSGFESSQRNLLQNSMRPMPRSSSIQSMNTNSTNSDLEDLSNTFPPQGGILTNYNTANLPPPLQFIDLLSAQFSLSSTQAANLHNLAWIGSTFDQRDLLFRLFEVAAHFTTQNLLRANQVHHTKLDVILDQIEENFKLNVNQKNIIIRVTRDAIFNPKKRDYDVVHLRVKDTLEKYHADAGFKAFASHAQHAKCYDSEIKSRCRNILNQFKNELIGSVFGFPKGEKMTLEALVVKLASKYKSEKKTEIGREHRDRIALLRRFVREHSEYNTSNTNEDNHDFDADDDESASSRSESPAPQPTTKRRRTMLVQTRANAIGLLAFWKAVDRWLKTLVGKWGNSTDSAGWRKYIEETVELERASLQSIPDISLGAVISGLPYSHISQIGSASNSTNQDLGTHCSTADISSTQPMTRLTPCPGVFSDSSHIESPLLPTHLPDRADHAERDAPPARVSQNEEISETEPHRYAQPMSNALSSQNLLASQMRDHSSQFKTTPFSFSPPSPPTYVQHVPAQNSHTRDQFLTTNHFGSPHTNASSFNRSSNSLSNNSSSSLLPPTNRARPSLLLAPLLHDSDFVRPHVQSPSPFGRSQVQSPSPLRSVYGSNDLRSQYTSVPGGSSGLTGSFAYGESHGRSYGGGQTESQAYEGNWPSA